VLFAAESVMMLCDFVYSSVITRTLCYLQAPVGHGLLHASLAALTPPGSHQHTQRGSSVAVNSSGHIAGLNISQSNRFLSGVPTDHADSALGSDLDTADLNKLYEKARALVAQKGFLDDAEYRSFLVEQMDSIPVSVRAPVINEVSRVMRNSVFKSVKPNNPNSFQFMDPNRMVDEFMRECPQIWSILTLIAEAYRNGEPMAAERSMIHNMRVDAWNQWASFGASFET
jgi:hypothetical protein